MRNALLTITLFSGLALGATGLAAQTQFPMSDSQDDYAAPIIGVAMLPEGRSAFAVPRPGEFPSISTISPAEIDYQTTPLRAVVRQVQSVFAPTSRIRAQNRDRCRGSARCASASRSKSDRRLRPRPRRSSAVMRPEASVSARPPTNATALASVAGSYCRAAPRRPPPPSPLPIAPAYRLRARS